MKTPLLLVILIGVSGCAYGRNLARDAGDIFTFGVTRGFGVTAQAGPILNGIGYNEPIIGLDDGSWSVGNNGNNEASLVLASARSTDRNETMRIRGKSYGSNFFLGMIPFGPEGAPSPHHWTRFEASASVGIGIRLGINPGEIVDLICGLFGFDLYHDDLPEVKKIDQKRKIDD